MNIFYDLNGAFLFIYFIKKVFLFLQHKKQWTNKNGKVEQNKTNCQLTEKVHIDTSISAVTEFPQVDWRSETESVEPRPNKAEEDPRQRLEKLISTVQKN